MRPGVGRGTPTARVPTRMGLRAMLPVWALAWIGCAQEGPPPGSLPDARPPQVERIVPGRDSIVPGFDDDAKIRFDEPVNLSSAVERQLKVSPAELYDIGTNFSEVSFKPRTGWRDGVVYCFELEPGISDLLNNRTEDPIEFCFSTGPPIAATRVTGRILDVLTGRPAAEGRVHFLALPADSTPYAAQVDGEGSFARRALPPGGYTAFGFVDQNRNLVLDRHLEPHDSLLIDLVPSGTLDLEFQLIPPDSTPPLLVQVEAPDSLTVRLQFDDPLPRVQPEGGPSVSVTDVETGVTVDVVAALVGEPATVRFPGQPGEEPAEEEAPPRPEEEEAPPAERGEVQAAIPQSELPSPAVSVRLAAGLPAGTYRVRAEGFVNLRGMVGGGDTTFVYEAPAADSSALGGEETEPTLPADTVPADTVPPGPLPADTVPRDTLRSGAGPPGLSTRVGLRSASDRPIRAVPGAEDWNRRGPARRSLSGIRRRKPERGRP